ncbi:MAG: carboxypeptidase-like regulatory domain-containing protein [candidate division KSB1 bacterium]|nr:carboxypeptidase-like regulatory domain-containing protein [candidate division KSB1 bacterium]
MRKKRLLLLMVWIGILVLTVFPLDNYAATTGKIAGKVIDKNTQEPLPGANVVIEGTKMGAATDLEGEYFIINVQPGIYAVRATMMGYTVVTKTNVRVAVDQTTTIDFELEPTVIEGQQISIVSERPVVDKDITGSQEIMDAGYIERAPIADLSGALSQKVGVYNTGETTYFRGGLASEVNYKVDGASLNSGLLSDNWQRLNTTAMQEVKVMTGGFNAEYGNAMSGVVNVVTKEASRQKQNFHGKFNYRMRPAGQYHWGPNMYSDDLWKYTNFDKEYWEGTLEDPAQRQNYANYFKRFYGWDGETVPSADQLLDTYREQITPDDVLGDYTERAEHEIEGTLYGALTENFTLLLTGRYKRGVNIFPQAHAYNPEYNAQAKLNYYFSSNKKLTLNVLRGWYKSATYTESNWNNMESSQEARWQPNADVRSPYDNKAYAPWGGYWLKGPQEKTINMATLKWQHTLSPATFYTVQFYLPG